MPKSLELRKREDAARNQMNSALGRAYKNRDGGEHRVKNMFSERCLSWLLLSNIVGGVLLGGIVVHIALKLIGYE